MQFQDNNMDDESLGEFDPALKKKKVLLELETIKFKLKFKVWPSTSFARNKVKVWPSSSFAKNKVKVWPSTSFARNKFKVWPSSSFARNKVKVWPRGVSRALLALVLGTLGTCLFQFSWPGAQKKFQKIPNKSKKFKKTRENKCLFQFSWPGAQSAKVPVTPPPKYPIF